MPKSKKKLRKQIPKASSFAISVGTLASRKAKSVTTAIVAPPTAALHSQSSLPPSDEVCSADEVDLAADTMNSPAPLKLGVELPPNSSLPGTLSQTGNLGVEPDVRAIVDSPDVQPDSRSWASVAKVSSVVRELGTPTEHISGVPFVLIPTENIEAAKVQFKDYVHASFRGRPPDIGRIIGIVNAIWAKSGPRIFVHRLNASCFLLKVVKPRSREIILSRNVWNIAGQPMFVSPWSNDFEPDPEPLTKAKVMVEFRGVPFLLFNDICLSRLATPVGKPVALAPEMAKCENFEVARVIVEVDLLKKLPTSIVSGFPNGKEFKIDISYPWLPPKCQTCNEFGHDDSHCFKNPNPEKGRSQHSEYQRKHGRQSRRQSRAYSRGRSRGPKPVMAWRIVDKSKAPSPLGIISNSAHDPMGTKAVLENSEHEVGNGNSLTVPLSLMPVTQDTQIALTEIAIPQTDPTEVPTPPNVLKENQDCLSPVEYDEDDKPFILVTRRKGSRRTSISY